MRVNTRDFVQEYTLLECIQCGRCTGGCPVSMKTALNIRGIIYEALIEDSVDPSLMPVLWDCTNCLTCTTRCPKDIKPADVITMASGKTVEVLNTDAEGRLILADALWYAAKGKPDYIIDAATLTGAQLVATGVRHAAVVSNREGLEALAVRVGQPGAAVVVLLLGFLAPIPYLARALRVAFDIRSIRLVSTTAALFLLHVVCGQIIDNVLRFGTPFR